jgi:hypothetical protein
MEFYRNNEMIDRLESPEQQIVPVLIIYSKNKSKLLMDKPLKNIWDDSVI